MTKTRTLSVLSVLATAALLAGVAFAVEDASPMLDSEDDSGTAAAQTAGHSDTDVNSSTDNNAHGLAVSTLATTTDLTGRAKGEAISTLASSNAQNTAAENPEPLNATATLATTTTASGRAKGLAISTSVRASAH